MTRYLSIDYGRKRIGLAVGASDSAIVLPIRAVRSTGRLPDDVKTVLAAAAQYEPDEFLVGLPLNMDGTEGSQAALSRTFGTQLSLQGGKPVQYWDERLSSFAADQLLGPGEFTRKQKKTRADSVAAQVILQDFLESRQSGAAP